MSSLLNENEKKFLNETDEILGDYLENEAIGDRLVTCTKRQINKKNFHKFDNFKKCIRNKMVILANPIERSFDEGKSFPHQEKTVIVPPLIEKNLVIKAMMKGHRFLKAEFNRLAEQDKKLKKLEETRDIFFLLVLVIIGKANLEFMFK